MITAVYARKSTEQNGRFDEAKSVTRQIAHACDYATRKGWTVDEAHILRRRRHLGHRVRQAAGIRPTDECS
jgi:hypothetical protein